MSTRLSRILIALCGILGIALLSVYFGVGFGFGLAQLPPRRHPRPGDSRCDAVSQHMETIPKWGQTKRLLGKHRPSVLHETIPKRAWGVRGSGTESWNYAD